MKKILSKQIIKFNGKDTLLEVMADTFNIGMVRIHMHKYDESKEKGNRVIAEVDTYVSIDEMRVLCHDILSGRIVGLIENKRKANKEAVAKGQKADLYYTAWQDIGGVSAKKLEERQKKALEKGKKLQELSISNRVREDKMSLARVIKIGLSSKEGYVAFTSECGAGEENKQGLIVARYGVKPDSRVLVPVSYQDLKKFALAVSANIQAYETAQYTNGAYLVDINFNN